MRTVFQFRTVLKKLLFTALLAAASLAIAAFDTIPKDQGIGGTGQISRGDDNGISGTGYIGTITDFGSIIVNGREIEVDDTTSVNIDGVAASLADLKKGYVIAARSNTINAVETASTVSVFHAVIGKLETYDPATGVGTILGQMIDFNSRLDEQTLAVGQWFAVSGLRSTNQVIIASHVEPSSPDRFLVRGKTQQIQGALKNLKITDRTVPKAGDLVLTGGISSGKAKVRKLEPYSAMSTLKDVADVYIESYLPHNAGSGHKLSVDAFQQSLMVPKSMNMEDFQVRDRLVISAHKSGGQFVVRQAEPAPFVDHASDNSKTLTKSSIESLSIGSSQQAGTSEQGGEVESENQPATGSKTQSTTDDTSSESQSGSSDEGSNGSNGSQSEGSSGGGQNSNGSENSNGAGSSGEGNGNSGEGSDGGGSSGSNSGGSHDD